MARTARQQLIDRAVIRALLASAPRLLPERQLQEKLVIEVTPAPTRSEMEESLAHHDSAYRVTGVEETYGRVWAICPEGKAWASAVGITTS